jgi:hypothetical protein
MKAGHFPGRFRRRPVLERLAVFLLLGTVFSSFGADKRNVLHGHVPAVVARLQAQGRLADTNQLELAIGLPLRNRPALDELIHELYDRSSTNFHKFITPAEFTARFGPTEADYESLVQFAVTNGFSVVARHGNRLVLDVVANTTNVQRAFQITLRTYRHPTENRNFFAPDTEPSVPTNLAVADIWGLSDYGRAQPQLRAARQLQAQAMNGSGPNGYYAGNDFRNAYAPGCTLTGAGQSVGLLEFSAYYQVDITNYERTIGLSRYVPLVNVRVGSSSPSTANNAEVALDIEAVIAMAPGLSNVIVYEEKTINPSSILSKMANDNLAQQLSSSWTWSGGPSATVDSAFLQMAAQGQSYFQAAGDNDAYTGAQILGNPMQSDSPVDSTNITVVGGTTLTMNGSGTSWASEKVWNYASYGGSMANEGSGGGISSYYTIPYWQAGVSNSANQGSATWRNVPDVALTADNIYVAYNNGNNGGFAGTSAATPLWAGFCALINQQSVALSGASVGFLNPAIYTIGASASYAACFHDITTGNNTGTNSPGLFNAVPGYDLCTGWGTPNGTNLINALASAQPYFLTQPTNQTVAGGNSVTFSTDVIGSPPVSYKWLFNGRSLSGSGNISGTAGDTLSIASANFGSAGNYSLVAANGYGSVTSSVATLTVLISPGFSTQPTNLTILSGNNATFSAAASGSTPLVYQWQQNGTNLANGAGVSGANSATLTLANVTASCAANYSVVVSNFLGSTTSSVAALTVVQPPKITSFSNQTIECGGAATFTVAVAGTPPLSYQWSLDGTPISGATSNSVSLANVHLPSHVVSVTVTNLYAGATSNATLTVRDTTAPVIALNGANPITVELGSIFTDPGATANDVCAGPVPVFASGNVNANATGTNFITYTSDDGNGNTNAVTRAVIVRDTTPPVISWSFTNLTVAAVTNCAAPMPDVTGTNYILANDLSGALTILQSPTNNFALPVGTNQVLISVADASGNISISTNTIVVQDQTPPLIFSQPQSQTNFAGTTANFSAAATACTPPAYQWFFNNAALPGQTNNSMTLNPVSVTNAGNYFVTVTTTGGSVTSSVAALTVFNPAPVISGVAANPDGTFTLNFTGTLGETYVLETTTNLLSPGGWLPIATNTLQTNAVWQFNDAQATNFIQRFYRLMLAPDPATQSDNTAKTPDHSHSTLPKLNNQAS